jgi:hypothetical protein
MARFTRTRRVLTSGLRPLGCRSHPSKSQTGLDREGTGMIMQYALFLSSIRLSIGSYLHALVMCLLNALDSDKAPW